MAYKCCMLAVFLALFLPAGTGGFAFVVASASLKPEDSLAVLESVPLRADESICQVSTCTHHNFLPEKQL